MLGGCEESVMQEQAGGIHDVEGGCGCLFWPAVFVMMVVAVVVGVLIADYLIKEVLPW